MDEEIKEQINSEKVKSLFSMDDYDVQNRINNH